MIKKVVCSLSLLGFFSLSGNAQSKSPCGTDEHYLRQLAAHPEIAERNEALNAEIANKLSKFGEKELSPFAKVTDDGSVVYDVPLVFHIVHDYGTEYLPDSDIDKCVSDLNKLFNKRNPDTINVIQPYKHFINNSTTRYIGNARITWHLATKDPNGNPTRGITRRRSYLAKTGSDLAKFDQWPSNNYMNIWIINSFGGAIESNVLAYSIFPASADVTPFYDGVITKASSLNFDNTIAHELGHSLNMIHTWGNTPVDEGCGGDDLVDDTPPTKGHLSVGCVPTSLALYDTACLTKRTQIGKLRLDSSLRVKADTSTTKGIVFKNRTASIIESFTFYPTAAIGSTYKIGLLRNSTLIDSAIVVSTVKDSIQVVSHLFKVPPADTATNFKLYFYQNPGSLRDSITPGTSIFPRGFNGTILLKTFSDDNFYNFFYDWKISYGYYKIYENDSLVDYPDTTNTQNVMDYSHCSFMFTNGQVVRMRAALTSPVAKRNYLYSPENLAITGALDAAPALKPKAEFSVDRGVVASTGIQASELSYFMCADNAASIYSFKFTDRSWQATATSKEWFLSNGATSSTPVGGSVTTKFATPGWASIKLVAANSVGSDTFETMPGIYVADPNAINPIGHWQDFANDADNAKWPIFNYYNNRYKWEIANKGVYDGKSIRYRSFDDRMFPETIVGDPSGDYDDFFTPAFDLSVLGAVNGNLNFMYSGAYATTNPLLMKDVLEIAYSTNCGGTWNTLKTMKDAEMQTVGTVSGVEFVPDWNEWKPVSIDLKAGTSTIRGNRVFFRFRYKPSSRPIGSAAYASGNNFYIDRINISDNPLSVNEMILGDKKAALAPNPATTNTYVLFQKPNANVKIEVLDMTGKLVYSINTKVDQNNARVEIPANQLGAKGVYIVRISGDDNLNQTEKLVVY